MIIRDIISTKILTMTGDLHRGTGKYVTCPRLEYTQQHKRTNWLHLVRPGWMFTSCYRPKSTSHLRLNNCHSAIYQPTNQPTAPSPCRTHGPAGVPTDTSHTWERTGSHQKSVSGPKANAFRWLENHDWWAQPEIKQPLSPIPTINHWRMVNDSWLRVVA